MSFRKWIVSQGIIAGFRFVNSNGKIKALAEDLDNLLDKEFPKKSEEIQKAIVLNLMLPLCRELLKERKATFRKYLSNEIELIDTNR